MRVFKCSVTFKIGKQTHKAELIPLAEDFDWKDEYYKRRILKYSKLYSGAALSNFDYSKMEIVSVKNIEEL